MALNDYKNRSIALGVAEKQIKLYKDVLALCPDVLETIMKFDGKQANRRLETALQEIDSGLHCKKSTYGDRWEIYFYTQDRSLTVETESWDGSFMHNQTFYIKDDTCYLARDGIHEDLYGRFTDENGKWIAKNICDHICGTTTRLEMDIQAFEKEIKEADALEAEKRKLKEMIQEHNKKVSWFGEAYFSLRI